MNENKEGGNDFYHSDNFSNKSKNESHSNEDEEKKKKEIGGSFFFLNGIPLFIVSVKTTI